MKISSREKNMLIFLCVAMLGAVLFMLVISPMNAEKAELEEQKELLAKEVGEMMAPIGQSFSSETEAQAVWQLSGPALNNKLDRLLYDKSYLLGNRITDKKGEALEMSDSSLIPIMPEFELFTFVKNMLEPYVTFMEFDPIEVKNYTYIMDEGKEYTISTVLFTIKSFNCVNYDPDSFYQMLDLLNNKSYIVVEDVKFNYSTRIGDLSIIILMTPGNLAEYDVIKGPDGRYIQADSLVCKYTNQEIQQSLN